MAGDTCVAPTSATEYHILDRNDGPNGHNRATLALIYDQKHPGDSLIYDQKTPQDALIYDRFCCIIALIYDQKSSRPGKALFK